MDKEEVSLSLLLRNFHKPKEAKDPASVLLYILTSSLHHQTATCSTELQHGKKIIHLLPC